jgi:hypothetical protein
MSSITIISDTPNCGITYNPQSDDHNSFIIQVNGAIQSKVAAHQKNFFSAVLHSGKEEIFDDYYFKFHSLSADS